MKVLVFLILATNFAYSISPFIINGSTVVNKNQTPGAYAVKVFKNDVHVYNASSVAISNRTFLTSAHNFEDFKSTLTD